MAVFSKIKQQNLLNEKGNPDLKEFNFIIIYFALKRFSPSHFKVKDALAAINCKLMYE